MSRSTSRKRYVLVVEDNPGDVHLLREAFRRCPCPPELVDVPDGIAALERLCGKDGRPDVILLDLNLPRMDGRELLSVIKQDEKLRRIPVIVLTSSGSDSDVKLLYELSANGYLIKPHDLEEFFALVQLFDAYWLRTSALPG